MIKRTFIKTTLGLALAASFAGASAQTTPSSSNSTGALKAPLLSSWYLWPKAISKTPSST